MRIKNEWTGVKRLRQVSGFSHQLMSLLSRLWSGRHISRSWLWSDRSWNLLHLGHLNFTVRLRHSLSEVFFAENSWEKIGSSTFLLGADQRLSGEGVLNGIYYCPLGFRAPYTCIPLCMRLVILCLGFALWFWVLWIVIRTTWSTYEKLCGLYQNNVTPSLAYNPRPGH